MRTQNMDFEKSAKEIFRLFFKSTVKVKNDDTPALSPWGVDLLMEYGGTKKLSLYLEENTMKSVVKRITGMEGLQNRIVVYEILGELACLIAGNALGESAEDCTFHHPVRSMGAESLMAPELEKEHYVLSLEGMK
jgi:hypothetical protein